MFKYIVGLAIVGALSGSNFELAISTILIIGIVMGCMHFFNIYQRKSAFSSAIHDALTGLGDDWKFVELVGELADPAALIFHPNRNDIFLISNIAYGSKIFQCKNIGELIAIDVQKPLIMGLNDSFAKIKLKTSKHSGAYGLVSENNWKLLNKKIL